MGCGMSTDQVNQPPFALQQGIPAMALPSGQDNVEEVFRKIDEEICRKESECPGPRLTILQSWIDHLEQVKAAKLSEVNETEVLEDTKAGLMKRRRSSVASITLSTTEPGGISKSEINMILSHDKSDTTKVVGKLGIVGDPAKAKQNEELLATMSKASLSYMSLDVMTTMIDLCKKRTALLLEKYTALKDLYLDLDGILTAVTGGSYVSSSEETLDKELENARTVRDKLGAVSEQWRICSTLIQAASKSAQQALASWSFCMAVKTPSEKISLCLDCRQSLHSAVMALAEAQNALPQVDIPSISTRQLTEMNHVNQYLLTDMCSPGRSKQLKAILDHFHRETISALEWVLETYEQTFQGNIQDAENQVQSIAKSIRSERLKFIRTTMGRNSVMTPRV